MANPIIRRRFGPANPRNDLTADEAKSLFSYDPETGEFKWRGDTSLVAHNGIRPNKRGRLVVTLTVTYQVSRLIWLMMTGEWPERLVDHKNRKPADNRWSNLRKANGSQNAINRSYKRKSPYRGVRIVHWTKPNGTHGTYWRARISINPGKRIELGCFPSAEEAYEAYKRAALKYHGPFARLL